MNGGGPIAYARAPGADLAYQRFGHGAVDMVCLPPMAQNIELAWERPEFRRVFEHLGSYAHVVHFDKRGTGMSDRTLAVPTLDERVDDTRAVMDAAGIDRAVMYGLSEGGPTAILFARTYPERVSSIILHASMARIVDAELSDAERAERAAWRQRFASVWGTERSMTLQLFAPTAAADPSYSAWHQRYERQCATPRGIEELMGMVDDIDVSALLPAIDVPTLVIGRTQEPINPIERSRYCAERIPGARLAEFDGIDHFPHIGDVSWLATVEEFVVGSPGRASRRSAPTGTTEVRTLGGFEVLRDGLVVDPAAWGSQRARQLCKRLVAGNGAPVTRDCLIDLLWPDDLADRATLGARLSVQLSTVRRILGGGVVADRTSIRLDLDRIRTDLHELEHLAATGDNSAVRRHYRGPFLPDDLYDDWATPVRNRALTTYVRCMRQLIDEAQTEHRSDDVASLAAEWLAEDPYDETPHRALVAGLSAAGRHGAARQAHAAYVERMDELGVTAANFEGITTP